MVKQIIQIGDKRLLQPSVEVETSQLSSPSIQKLITDLIDTVSQEDLNSAGLSAVQIGSLLRICVCRKMNDDEDFEAGEWEIMINPDVKPISKKTTTFWEGCLSIGVGHAQLFGPVRRPSEVEVTYIDIKGKKQKVIARNYYSHIVQHEIDHLNGKLFLSYIKNPKNIWRSDELDKYLQKRGEYPPIEPDAV